MIKNLSLVLLLLCSAAAYAAPKPFTAHYTVRVGNIVAGEIRRSLSVTEQGQFVFESETRSSGLAALFVKDHIIERSVWRYDNQTPRPLHFQYQKTGGKKERNYALSFDWAAGVVKDESSADPWQARLDKGTQDRLLYQLTLMYDLQSGRTELAYPLVDGHKLRNYRFQKVAEEILETPLGPLKTVKLSRILESDEKTVTLWCAPSLDYLPVRIEQNEKDGDRFSATIRAVDGLGTAQVSQTDDAR
jgi:hypothetical protein